MMLRIGRMSCGRAAMAALFLFVGLGATPLRSASAVSVEQSTLSTGAVVVQLSASEVDRARNRNGAARLGRDVATKMVRLAGIPESFTGKVAALPVWLTLCGKYTDDIYREATDTPAGNALTLRYEVDLDGVRAVWAATEMADDAIPGGEVTGAIIDVLNALLDAVLQ